MTSKVDAVFPYGKYKGMLISEIYEQDPRYLEWAYINCEVCADVQTAVEYHLGYDRG